MSRMAPTGFFGFPASDRRALRVSDALPSGQKAELFEVLVDTVGGEAWIRFRFLAPGIGEADGQLSFEQVELDFEHLCQTVAMPYVQQFDLQADVLVVSLLDKPIAFGTSDPDVTQFIEAFRLAEGTCVWEGLW